MAGGGGVESGLARVAERVPPSVVSGFLRAAFGLPRPVRRVIAGAPVRLEGQELSLDAQFLLRLISLEGSKLSSPTVAAARGGLARSQIYLRRAPGRPVGAKEVDAGGVPARLYTPRGLPDGSPLLVFYHGGGWVIGDLDTHDTVCRYLAVHAEVRVLSVDYRLAPEHPYPAAADDALAAYAYAAANAGALGADPDAIAVGGDSAGGNLAAVVGLLAERRPDFALLIYPATDMTVRRRSREVFGDGFYLTDADMVWFSDHYCPDVGRRAEPKASPLLAEDLSGFPTTYLVTAGFDPLRDEGEEFAKRLGEARVPVALRRQEDLFHGFANTWSLGGRFREALSEAAGALRTGLYAGPRKRG
ncbi:alpha/beta hydrolase [Actinomadura syzygii]|uniref:Alpha/beta hydrolase n=1 Tax=Actinomadura syzygii TaxID=1427538 RepID=A0A5D0TXX7_9ACTN|nr:alpha/beta hydrolase [Actinomadura syzygii]